MIDVVMQKLLDMRTLGAEIYVAGSPDLEWAARFELEQGDKLICVRIESDSLADAIVRLYDEFVLVRNSSKIRVVK